MIRLRDYDAGDAARLVELADNKNVSRYMVYTFPYPYTRKDAEWWIETGARQHGGDHESGQGRVATSRAGETTSVKQSFFILAHILVGCVAFALALFYLLSDALSFEDPSGLLAQRPRGFIAACFGLAAASLLFSARRRDLIAYKVFGYGSIGIAAFTLWLIFKGMETSAV